MNLKRTLFTLFCASTMLLSAQSIQEINYNVSGGITTSYDSPGKILYPTGYSRHSYYTPVIFVHGIGSKLSSSYEANIDQVKSKNLNAAFVQLEPFGSTIDNGKLLKQMIDKVRTHYNVATVSIVAHSKGGLDTERALYGQNPYTNTNLPSFGYEGVDGVHTLSSPVKGARVADLGATLSWFSGVTWAAMWYTNGWSLTSGNVNSFHNWAGGWTINSNGTFKNYNNPNGASYSRINMKEDNTTFWYAHQSDDECYDDIWYYCYVGRPFHHSVGAYADANWEWDWFDSGWENWYSNSDGFISEYRSKRDVNTNPYPSLTQNAGDFNSRVINDANHSSLWESGENHFNTEVMPYLNLGLYNSSNGYKINSSTDKPIKLKANKEKVKNAQILLSSGNMYFGKDATADFIVEEDNKEIEFIIYSNSILKSLELINVKTNKKAEVEITDSKKDEMSGAYVGVGFSSRLLKGEYKLSTNSKDFLLLANNRESATAFALNLNFNEKEGYNGEILEVGIANKENAINFNEVSVVANLSEVASGHDKLIEMDRVKVTKYAFKPTEKEGIFAMSFPDLNPGSVYSIRIEAQAKNGDVLLSRNIVKTFYVRKDVQMKNVSVKEEIIPIKIKTNINMGNIQVYPNPASSIVTINSKKETINSIVLMSIRGHVIENILINNDEYKLNIEHYNLPKGLYLLKVITNTGTSVEKLLVN